MVSALMIPVLALLVAATPSQAAFLQGHANIILEAERENESRSLENELAATAKDITAKATETAQHSQDRHVLRFKEVADYHPKDKKEAKAQQDEQVTPKADAKDIRLMEDKHVAKPSMASLKMLVDKKNENRNEDRDEDRDEDRNEDRNEDRDEDRDEDKNEDRNEDRNEDKAHLLSFKMLVDKKNEDKKDIKKTKMASIATSKRIKVEDDIKDDTSHGTKVVYAGGPHVDVTRPQVEQVMEILIEQLKNPENAEKCKAAKRDAKLSMKDPDQARKEATYPFMRDGLNHLGFLDGQVQEVMKQSIDLAENDEAFKPQMKRLIKVITSSDPALKELDAILAEDMHPRPLQHAAMPAPPKPAPEPKWYTHDKDAERLLNAGHPVPVGAMPTHHWDSRYEKDPALLQT